MSNAVTKTWLELTIEHAGSEVFISASSSRKEQRSRRPLGVDRDVLLQFASAVARAAARGLPLSDDVLAQARTIRQAVLAGDIGVLFGQLCEAAKGPLVVRFAVDVALQAVPWEALCNADEALGFWGTSATVFPVRSVFNKESWQPREVRGAVKVLAIAPTGSAGLANLKQALAERIATGEVEWFDPVEGPAARVKGILDRLRREPIPHVIHFLGHGDVDDYGRPSLRLGDDNREEKWLAAEVLAQHLKAHSRGLLRLVVLEACEGAKPGAFASAAEILAGAGADAVVAHLWPVRSDVARTFSTEFYRVLTAANHGGDVVFAANEARRVMLGEYDSSTEALCPVVYLRAPDGVIFDFERRVLMAPRARVVVPEGAPEVPLALARIVRAPFSLVLGDRWKDDPAGLESFRKKLSRELQTHTAVAPPNGLPMGTLVQWFALHRGADELDVEFQDAFDVNVQGPPIVTAIARVLGPGVHTTLLRNPWLEQSVAELQPDRTIYVLQPYGAGAFVLKREAGAGKRWERLASSALDTFDDTRDVLVLRPYRGYMPTKKFARPLLTEDDYFLRLREIWSESAMPPRLAEVLGGTLSRRPALLVGLSMLTANHRMLLHTLYARGVPRQSVAVVDLADGERQVWESGAGLPGKDGYWALLNKTGPF